MTPRIGSMCSGYGGLELGLLAVTGGSVAWHAENDPHAAKVLEARFPGVPNRGDITTTDWTQVEPVDILCAGFPCQDISLAGRGAGIKEGTRSGLWFAIADAIGVLRPRIVVLENVAAIVSRRPGLDVVLASLATLGFDAEWLCLRASDADAPHERARWFCAATESQGEQMGASGLTRARPGLPATDAASDRRREGWAEPARQLGRPDAPQRRDAATDAGRSRLGERPADTPAEETGQATGHELAGDRGPRPAAIWGPYAPAIERWAARTGRPAPSPTVPGGRTGRRLNPRLNEWMMGLPDGWVTDILPRNPALKCIGNGVVPQQAELALRTLLPPAWAAAA